MILLYLVHSVCWRGCLESLSKISTLKLGVEEYGLLVNSFKLNIPFNLEKALGRESIHNNGVRPDLLL
jgi:hypothetical protein